MRPWWAVTIQDRIRGRVATLGRNLTVQVATSLLSGFYRGAYTAVWQPFVLFLGGSVQLLGLLESLGGWGGAVSSLMQLLGGRLADRVGRRPIILFSSLFAALSFSCFTLAALLHQWLLLIPGVILAGTAMMGRAAQSSVTAESVQEGRRGSAYSMTAFAITAPGVVASVVGGQVSERWGYLPIMLTALVLEFLVLVILLLFLRETLSGERPRIRRADWRELLRMVRVPRRLWRVVIPIAGDSLFFGIAGSLLFGILKDAYQFSDGQLGWINAFFLLSWAIAQLPAGRLVDRYGCKRFIVISEVGLGCCIVMWLLWPTFVGVSFAYALLGVTAALWVPALLKLLANSVPEAERGESIGRVFTFQGLARFTGPYLASWLYSWKGYRAPLLVGLGGVIVVVVLMGILIQDPPVTQLDPADGTPLPAGQESTREAG